MWEAIHLCDFGLADVRIWAKTIKHCVRVASRWSYCFPNNMTWTCLKEDNGMGNFLMARALPFKGTLLYITGLCSLCLHFFKIFWDNSHFLTWEFVHCLQHITIIKFLLKSFGNSESQKAAEQWFMLLIFFLYFSWAARSFFETNLLILLGFYTSGML